MSNFNNATTNLPIPDTAGVRAYKAQRLAGVDKEINI